MPQSGERDAVSSARDRVHSGESWSDFCDALKAAGQTILRLEAPDSELDRAEGWRYLSRLVRLALESKVEFDDQDRPEFYSLSHQTAKIGADNPDNDYHNSTIAGDREYRITGTRGAVPYLTFGTKANRYATDGTMASTGELDAANMVVDADGRFEIIVSQAKQGANWLPISADSTMVLVRQTFFDRTSEVAASYSIERIGAPIPPPRLSAEQIDNRLKGAAAFVRGTAHSFADLSQKLQEKPNDWWTTEQDMWWRIGGDPNIFYLHAYWDIKPDEALVIRSEIPQCKFWNIQVDNYWWESLDYRHLNIHVNKYSAKYGGDGTVVIVISAKDIGYGNHLDTGGHGKGTLLLRWVNAETHPIPSIEVVKLADLADPGVRGGKDL